MVTAPTPTMASSPTARARDLPATAHDRSVGPTVHERIARADDGGSDIHLTWDRTPLNDSADLILPGTGHEEGFLVVNSLVPA